MAGYVNAVNGSMTNVTWDGRAVPTVAVVGLFDPLGALDQALLEYLPPILLLFCIVGSIISSIILWDMIKEVTPLCIYLFLLGPMDIAYMFLASGNMWLAHVAHASFKRDVISRSDTMCKSFHFLYHFVTHFDSWLIVCLMCETLRLSRRASNASGVTSKRVIDVIVVALVLLALLNAHYFWTYGLAKVDHQIGAPSKEAYCIFNAKNLQGYQDEPWYGEILDMIHAVVADIVPMVIILVCLAWNLVSSRRHRRSPDKRATHDETRLLYESPLRRAFSKYNEKIASGPMNELRDKTFLYIPALYLVCSLPYFVCRPLGKLILDSEDEPEVESEATWGAVSAIFWGWKMTFYACKLLIYCGTSRWFRRKLKLKFARLRKGGKKRSQPGGLQAEDGYM